ncbi:hypothetical protein [Prosthecochloris vibrioformis]|uniref:DUF4199 domain-containing protein n=1 Tax=Prosthecochloris vibrioformis TaxID=1098 RepID=A0A5C4S383_PROVB|nr:hypothetical protein [Prosthecochloris vibrioformis]TNJ37923.1 hypothetical protein FGF68_01730 [Prosthecochloris vibrioformis]
MQDSRSGNEGGAQERRRSLWIGALMVLLTTTAPYLTLLNAFFFSGILFSGALATYLYIVRAQVRLPYGDAFFFGSLAGAAGAVLSAVVGYLLVSLAGYRPGIEGLMLLIRWMEVMAPDQSALVGELRAILEAPVQLSLADLVFSLLLSVGMYAPVAGLGGVMAVWRLKRMAARS